MAEEGTAVAPGESGDAAPGTAPAADPQPWTHGFAEDLAGFVEHKGWADAGAAVESYRNLEKLHGTPPEQVVRLPADFEDAKEVGEFYTKLGRPVDAAAYELPDLGEGVPDVLTEPWRELAFEHGLSQRQTRGIAEKFTARLESMEDARIEQSNMQSAQDVQKLKAEWGQEYNSNIQFGKNFKAKFGLTDEQINAMDEALGSYDFLKLASVVGRSVGESAVPDTDGAGGDSFLGINPGKAQAQIDEMMMPDSDFMKRYRNSDHKIRQRAVEEMARLQKAAHPEPPA